MADAGVGERIVMFEVVQLTETGLERLHKLKLLCDLLDGFLKRSAHHAIGCGSWKDGCWRAGFRQFSVETFVSRI